MGSVHSQVGFIGFGCAVDELELQLQPVGSVEGQQSYPVPVRLGGLERGDGERVELGLRNDVVQSVDVLRTLRIGVVWRNKTTAVCCGFRFVWMP